MANIARTDWGNLVGGRFASLSDAIDALMADRIPRWRSGIWGEDLMPVDVSEADGALRVVVAVPGFAADEVEVRVAENILSITAEHREEHEEKDERYYRHERYHGAMSRRIELPGAVSDTGVEAELKNGELTLTIPIPSKAQARQIPVHAI